VRSTPPMGADDYAECKPVYEEMPGWQETTLGIKDYANLPENAKSYLHRIEEISQIRIDIISTGPDREETIVLHNPFD